MEIKESSQKLTLKEFVRKEKDLLIIMNIFAGLCLFIKELITGEIGETLSFLFLSGFVLLWIELWRSFPKKAREETLSLWLFENISIINGTMIIFYWLAKGWSIGFFPFLIWICAIFLLGSVFKKFFQKVKFKSENLYEWIIIFSMLLLLWGINFLTKKFTSFFENIFKPFLP